jgi:pimeloyl-ACP methyl ester carboxylesterase
MIAALEPPNLRGVVLSGGFATSPLRGWRRTLTWDLVPLLSHVPLPGVVVRYLMVGDEAPRALVELVTGAVGWLTPKVLCTRVREALHVDVRAELAQVRVPVLYLQPTKDRLVDPLCAEEMRTVKAGRTVRIEGPHMLLQSEPVACAEAVAGFVRELGAGGQERF